MLAEVYQSITCMVYRSSICYPLLWCTTYYLSFLEYQLIKMCCTCQSNVTFCVQSSWILLLAISAPVYIVAMRVSHKWKCNYLNKYEPNKSNFVRRRKMYILIFIQISINCKSECVTCFHASVWENCLY